MKGIENMTKTVKYEYRYYYDSFGTGNYTEDESKRVSRDITEETAQSYITFWNALGCTYYETSKAHFYEKQTDARHYIQYILYK